MDVYTEFKHLTDGILPPPYSMLMAIERKKQILRQIRELNIQLTRLDAVVDDFLGQDTLNADSEYDVYLAHFSQLRLSDDGKKIIRKSEPYGDLDAYEEIK